MNSPKENRRKVALGLYGPEFNSHGPHGEERWGRMLLNYNDMKYAEAYGGVNLRPNRNGAGELHRLPDRRHF